MRMRVPRASLTSYRQQAPIPTTIPQNTATTFISTVPANAQFGGQLLGSDFGLDLGEIDSTGSESFTLYKSDLDDCIPEENNENIQSGPQQGNTTFGSPFTNLGTPRQGPTISIGSLSNRSPSATDASELRREIMKSITTGSLKRNEPSPVTSIPTASPARPAAVNNKKQRGPKYQFDTATDFPSRGRKAAGGVKKPRAPRIKKEPTSTASAANLSTPAVNNDVIGPSASASFTISIPSTSKTPATTMYLPFIARRQSLKSHQLGATDSNLVRIRESVEESEARRIRVIEAMNDDTTEVKDVKYFVDKNIEEYLEKRGYLQPYLRAEKVITKGIFASIISHENSISNAISYGPRYEAHEIIGEIERFWEFYQNLKKANLQMSQELKPMLIPMLLYFYLECYVSGLVPVALRLYVEFSKKFLAEDATQESYDILFQITKIASPEAFDDNDLLQAFRSQERRFILSLATFERLKKHVLSKPCPLMLHLFSNRFALQMKDTAIVAEKFVEYPYPEQSTIRERTGSRAADVIKRLRESVNADLPVLSLCLATGRPLCAAASPAGSMIAFGMGDGRGIILLKDPTKAAEENDDSDEDVQEHESGLQELVGHVGRVFDVGFHPSTKRLFSVGQDCTMKVWDLENRECRAVYKGHNFPVGALDITDSGILLATGSIDKTARIWVPERTNYVRLLAGHYSSVTSVKFHPNEAYIATGSMDTSVRLWSVSDGNMARIFTGFDGRVTCLGFHESGKYILAGGADPIIRIWDIAQGEVLTELPCPTNCTSLAINQNILAAAFDNNQVRFWNFKSVLNTNNLSELEDETHYNYKDQMRKVDCRSNSLLKLHFATPRHLLALGEEYTSPEDDNLVHDSPQTEQGEEAEDSDHCPSATEEEIMEQVLEEINTHEEQDAFSELDNKLSRDASAFDWPNAEDDEDDD